MRSVMRRHRLFDKRTGQTFELPCDQDAPLDPMLRDCPECSAALARGEEPIIMTGAEIQAAEGIDLDALLAVEAEDWESPPPRPRHSLFGRRPRWRDLKRSQ
jgi:hypothetical protein